MFASSGGPDVENWRAAVSDFGGGFMFITLIGYRGTGKSSVAPELAARLEWAWVDADREVVARAGRSIAEIFATDGEPEFRRLERETLVTLLARDKLVLAAGGGAILNADTRRDLRAAGPVVWLQSDVATLARRLGADDATAGQRPALTGGNAIDEIAAVLARREPLYREAATISVSTVDRTIAEIVDEILAALPRPLVASGASA